ncbi:MAG TPA: homoserine dehydrogenase [Hyphomicrobiales bacterium]|nr:homoserine dehydrogenase [Hyphomicrobiales bacterium]
MTEPLKVGIAGLGTVGAAVARLLAERADGLSQRCGREIRLAAVSAKQRKKDRGIDLCGAEWFADAAAMAREADIDVVVELIGGEDGPALAVVEAALKAGRHVVTANKALLARHGVALARLAEDHHVSLNFEAAVAGGIPIIKVLRESLAGNRISRIYGILNGTCNYILTRMEREGRPFDEILKDAQRIGYAEADPAFDISGHDAAHKLAILTSLAFGTRIDFESIYVEGIESIAPDDLSAADELGFRIKLLGVAMATDTGIEQRVHPTMVPKSSPIAEIDGVTNAIAVDGDYVGEVMLVGPGAGGKATASAVVGDICDIAGGAVLPPLAVPARALKPYKRARMRAHVGGYFIRLSVFDRPGAFAAIAKRMAEQEISLESIMQKGARNGGEARPRPVILITHETTEAQIRKALAAITKDGHIAGDPQMIRIARA